MVRVCRNRFLPLCFILRKSQQIHSRTTEKTQLNQPFSPIVHFSIILSFFDNIMRERVVKSPDWIIFGGTQKLLSVEQNRCHPFFGSSDHPPPPLHIVIWCCGLQSGRINLFPSRHSQRIDKKKLCLWCWCSVQHFKSQFYNSLNSRLSPL